MCKDYDIARSVAQRDNLDGILMDGTQVFKKGVYRGGYYDKSRQVPAVQAKLLFVDASHKARLLAMLPCGVLREMLVSMCYLDTAKQAAEGLTCPQQR